MIFNFLIKLCVHIIALFFIILIYEKKNNMNFNYKAITIVSILGSILILACYYFLTQSVFEWGLMIFLILSMILYFLNFKNIFQIIYYSSFITSLIFYIYSITGLLTRIENIFLNSISLIDYLIAIVFSIIIECILIYLLKIDLILPNEKISIIILFLIISTMSLELYYLSILDIETNIAFNLVIYISIGLLLFSSNIIIQYLYNDFHQLTVVSQNNFLSKITDSYIQGIHQEQEKVFKIKHDIKNNLIILQQLINDNQITKANQIIDEISSHLEYKKAVVYTGNIFIDAYLTYIINNSPMEIKLQCNDLKDLDYKPDILAIIINLVDNAVENANHYVSIQIKHEKLNNILIKVSNDCDNDPTKRLKKSKKKGDHGYGLRIVRDTVNQHQGTYLTSYQHGIFTTYVVLNIGEDDEK